MGYLRFWGVRGSLPVPGPDTVRYGGNTACVELWLGGALVVLDGGSGLRALGAALPKDLELDLLLSHTHLDHVCGLPFFAPLFQTAGQVRIWAADRSIRDVLRAIWSEPLMPSVQAGMRAHLTFRDFRSGDTLTLRPGLVARTVLLNHPGSTCGYRIEGAGVAVVYMTDTEPGGSDLDPAVVALAAGADVLVHDASYLPERYPAHAGWGHSTWEHAVALADAAGVGRLVLFHHDPGHDDGCLDRIAASAAERRPGTVMAREGLRLELPGLELPGLELPGG